MKTRILSMIATALACGFLTAQPEGAEPTEPAPPPKPQNAARGIWQATLPGGTYLVAVDRITSVSRHKYLLDSTLVVDEVTIDTTGQALARFYYITPVAGTTSAATPGTLIDKGKELLDLAGQRTGLDATNMVIKKYPETTHARTVEYRLPGEQQLTALFNSASQCWQSGKGGQYTQK